MNVNLFTYGVLMYEELLTQLVGNKLTCAKAVLPNHQRRVLEKKGWPQIPVVVSEEGSIVSGLIAMNVDPSSLSILDDFEDTKLGLYKRLSKVAVLDSGEEIGVEVYVGGEAAEGFLTNIWYPETFVAKNFEQYKNDIIPKFKTARKK
ncbi:gamma-glutamylcyclotransferase [Porticoccaceae bacterium]|nr:gamma-glutamylcyclotransferase [Porticoccaceae bacterium]